MNRSTLTPLLVRLLSVLLLWGVAASAPADELRHFITRDVDRLVEGDAPYRFVSFNVPNLLVVEDAYSFTRPNPWRWPDEYEIQDALWSVRQMGGRVVRTYVLSVRRQGSDMGDCVHVLAPGEFNEEAFRTLDRVLEVANRTGVRVMIPLVDNWRWMGGIAEYAAFRDKPAEAFWSDPEIIADFKATIEYVINRRNTITGIVYRDDPAIFGWETGNEIDATPEWTRQIVAHIRQLDPNHLIIDGRSFHGFPSDALDDPNIDVITTHHYPGQQTDFVPSIQSAHAQTRGKKAYFVGEFGFVDTPHIARVLDTVINDGIDGALLWSLRFHRREGGFYWHSEGGTGRNVYKAYHWPGFASGEYYDERQVVEMVRAKAYEIRAMVAPTVTPPRVPRLLPIEHPSKISWQGTAGAAAYDVERASAAEGPWATVGKNVSDAAVQYRPLFHDDQAASGERYYYRVVARNEAGVSPPSNVVGPVRVKHRTLVDECVDLSLTKWTEGDIWLATDTARRVQEDVHRFAMSRGATLEYRVPRPIAAWNVFAFAADPTARLSFSASTDGEQFEPVEIEREAYPSSDETYGYLTPVLYRGKSAGEPYTFLRIVLPASADSAVRADDPKQRRALYEVSRVEIEYDRVD